MVNDSYSARAIREFIAVNRLRFTRKSTSSSVFMIVVALAMFLLFTVYWSVDIYVQLGSVDVETADVKTVQVIQQLTLYGQTPAWALMVSRLTSSHTIRCMLLPNMISGYAR